MIYYSHVNEDSRPEQLMLTSGSYSRLVAVAGSGERVLSLMLGANLEQIDIVDPNPEALFLTELKLSALRLFTAVDYLYFIGFYTRGEHFATREEMLPKVLERLPGTCAAYWRDRQPVVASGRLLLCGHFETFLMRVHALIKPLFGARINTVLRTPLSEWGGYERRVWNLLRETFKYKVPYRLMGNRDPAFIGRDADPSAIGEALQQLFVRNEQGNSFFVHLLFRGDMRHMARAALPDSLCEGFLGEVKDELDQKKVEIRFHPTDLRTYLKGNQGITNTFISASDLLSFEPPGYMEALLDLLCTSRPGGTNQIVWRSFLKHREWNHNSRERPEAVIEDISRYERTRMYRVYSAVI